MKSIDIPIEVPGRDSLKAARERIRGKVHKTPLFTSDQLNGRLNARIFFKAENLQKAGSFKSRGAVNAVFSIPEKKACRGVCTKSSGNHAQALARAAALRNIPAYIVMPETAPKVKVNAVQDYGGKVTFCKPTLQAREEKMREVIAETGACLVHPSNDPEVIAGQSTVAQEIYEQMEEEPDKIITPVGGGGLLSGTALAVHHFYENTKVIAAEPEGADDAFRSFQQGKFIPSENPQTIADGLLTSLGSNTFPVMMNYVDKVVTVNDEAISHAMHWVWERMKIIIEPSAAVSLAPLIEQKVEVTNKTVVVIFSGGNVDLNKLPWQKDL